MGGIDAVKFLPSGEMVKRKRLSTNAAAEPVATVPTPVVESQLVTPPSKRARTSRQTASKVKKEPLSTNPEENANIIDGTQALRASPDSDVPSLVNGQDSDSPLSELSDVHSPVKTAAAARSQNAAEALKPENSASGPKAVKKQTEKDKIKEPQFLDPEAEGEEEADEEEIKAALSRPPPVNSDYLPLPWKGRLGYVSTPHNTVA